MIVDTLHPPFRLAAEEPFSNPAARALALQRRAFERIQQRSPDRLLRALAAIADQGLEWVETGFCAGTCAEIALSWPEGLDEYLEEHRQLFEQDHANYPEVYDPEYHVRGALRSFVLAVLESIQGLDPKPVHTALVVRATVATLRGCNLASPEGVPRDLDATLRVLDAANLVAAANDNAPALVFDNTIRPPVS